MKFNVNINQTNVSLDIESIDAFLRYCSFQRPYASYPPKPESRNLAPFELSWSTTFNKLCTNGVLDKTPKKVIDVGTGMGLLPLLLSEYFKDAEFILIDRARLDTVVEYQSNNNTHGFYTGFDVFENVVATNGLDRSRFTIIDPDDDWPLDVDLVVSTLSWCWHYPRLVYWDRLVKSLSTGGIVSLDVSNWGFENTIEHFSSYFQSNTRSIAIPEYPHKFPKSWRIDEHGNRGYSCAWKNNRI